MYTESESSSIFIESFKFLAIDKSEENEPCYYEVTDDDLEIYMNGGFLQRGNSYTKGIMDLLDEYVFRVETGNWVDHIDMIKHGSIIIE